MENKRSRSIEKDIYVVYWEWRGLGGVGERKLLVWMSLGVIILCVVLCGEEGVYNSEEEVVVGVVGYMLVRVRCRCFFEVSMYFCYVLSCRLGLYGSGGYGLGCCW